MKQLLICLLAIPIQVVCWAQREAPYDYPEEALTFRHYDFVGAGHSNELAVVVSSSASVGGKATIDGFPIQNSQQLKEASRFLAQSTFGADMATIQMTAAMGYEAWLDEQFQLPAQSYLSEFYKHATLYGDQESEGDDVTMGAHWFRSAWTTNILTAPDLLRHRLAFIWSQIMVINTHSDFFFDFGNIPTVYYDSLYSNTFQNYRKLIEDVTLSPAMGVFLSHYGNPKADTSKNIHPDENYAREILQLFSIGLWELNPNGTRKRDANGQFIPTYTNSDIKEFAQVFTGLADGRPQGRFGAYIDDFEGLASMTVPMRMYEDFHDASDKNLLNGVILPAGQSGMEDINQALDHLSNHPNTAPFIARSLIRFLTTSNPSPGYVQRVASVFKPDEVGNFKKVIKAILLDEEARNCQRTAAYSFGKLREPLVRYMNYLRAFPLSTGFGNGDFPFEFDCTGANLAQSPLEAPSVFNFFLPEYQAPGAISQRYLESPEFQILNSTNSIATINEMNKLTIQRAYFRGQCNSQEFEQTDKEGTDDAEDFFQMDYTVLYDLAGDADLLIEHLDIVLANGLLTGGTKKIIKDAIVQLQDEEQSIRMATYLIMISPDYVILK